MWLLIIAAAGMAPAAAFFYMKMPACWLCEFDEWPGEMHLAGLRGRMGIPGIWAAGTVTVFLSARLLCTVEWSPAADSVRWLAVLTACRGLAAGAVCAAAAVSLGIIILSDMEYMIIPDVPLLTAGAATLLMPLTSGAEAAARWTGLGASASGGITGAGAWMFAASVNILKEIAGVLAGAAGGGLALLLCMLLSALFYGRPAIGTGDLKLMLVCGALTGSFTGGVMVFVLSTLFSGIYMSLGLIAGKLSSGSLLPMAPFIILSTAVLL